MLSAALVASLVPGPAPANPPAPDKRQAGLTPEQQKAELSALYDQAVDRGVNAVIVQVRPTAANRLGHMGIVQSEHYAHPAQVPVTAGVPGRSPHTVRRLEADPTGDAVRLTWRGDGSSCAVHRVDGRPEPCDLSNATPLVATVRSNAWVDHSAPDHRVTYVVTALDRAYRKSRPARAVVRP